MSDTCKFRMILHFSDFEHPYSLKLFNMEKRIEGSEITFEITKEKFNQFETTLRENIYILEPSGKIKMKYTLNLLKEKNTYHLFSLVGQIELYELLFYDEDKIELIVDGKEIKEYDSLSKFKRFSLINIKHYKIKINGTEINIQNYLNFNNYASNSYQLSFYDIQQKLIVSKKIEPFLYMNFSDFYEKNNSGLKDYSSDLDELKKNEKKFKKNVSVLYENSLIFFNKMTKELNLNLPENSLKKIINDNKYLEFIFCYIKLKIFFYFLFIY